MPFGISTNVFHVVTSAALEFLMSRDAASLSGGLQYRMFSFAFDCLPWGPLKALVSALKMHQATIYGGQY